jgi:hypothetical protein
MFVVVMEYMEVVVENPVRISSGGVTLRDGEVMDRRMVGDTLEYVITYPRVLKLVINVVN